MDKVVFLGMGYIGLPTAAVIADQTHCSVIGVDINNHVVNTINAGKIHIVEPGLGNLVNKVVKAGKLLASTIVENADVFVIAVPTPFNSDHSADLSYVQKAVSAIIPFLMEGNLVVLESTSPVGTTQIISKQIFSSRPDLKDKVYIAYCPERVLPGNVIHELKNNDRIVGGINQVSTDKARDFYKLFVSGNVYTANDRTAELCKLVENASRDVQIAFANELSIICDSYNINVWELINLANKHPRVNILNPGCGVGGHCIAVDPWFIVADNADKAKLIHTARLVNDYKPDWCVEKIKDVIAEFVAKNNRPPVIACFGLAFKPDIDDLRESPAVQIVEKLKSLTDIKLLVVEPHINSHTSLELSDISTSLSNADVIVWLVKHSLFKEIIVPDSKVVIDFVGIQNKL